MGRRNKFADNVALTDTPYELTVHKDKRHSPRAYTPSDNDSDSGHHSLLVEDSMNGDWSWKPHRDKRIGDKLQTFSGVPKGAAELYGPRILS